MTFAQNLIDNFSNKSKTYKDNFFHFSHGERQWEVGLAYTFDRAAKTLDGAVQFLQRPTFDLGLIASFSWKDVLKAKRAQSVLEKTFSFDEYLDEPREYVEGWPLNVTSPTLSEKSAIVYRAKQQAEADLKIIGLQAFQRATRKYHEWGERPYPAGLGATYIARPVYRSDVQLADILVRNTVHTSAENKRERTSLALFALVTVGVPSVALVHHLLTQAPDNNIPVEVPQPAVFEPKGP